MPSPAALARRDRRRLLFATRGTPSHLRLRFRLSSPHPQVSKSSIPGGDVPPGALISFLQKGLQYLELEANLNEVRKLSLFSRVCIEPVGTQPVVSRLVRNRTRLLAIYLPRIRIVPPSSRTARRWTATSRS